MVCQHTSRVIAVRVESCTGTRTTRVASERRPARAPVAAPRVTIRGLGAHEEEAAPHRACARDPTAAIVPADAQKGAFLRRIERRSSAAREKGTARMRHL